MDTGIRPRHFDTDNVKTEDTDTAIYKRVFELYLPIYALKSLKYSNKNLMSLIFY